MGGREEGESREGGNSRERAEVVSAVVVVLWLQGMLMW